LIGIQHIAGHASILVSQRDIHPAQKRLEDAFVHWSVTTTAKEEQSTFFLAASCCELFPR
jgi:hypothetical protein